MPLRHATFHIIDACRRRQPLLPTPPLYALDAVLRCCFTFFAAFLLITRHYSFDDVTR